jgi:hypothetical protein
MLKTLTSDQYERVANDYGCIEAWFRPGSPDRLIAWRVMLNRNLPRHAYRELAAMRRDYWRLWTVRCAALRSWVDGGGTRAPYIQASGETMDMLRAAPAYYIDALRERPCEQVHS